jgi:hypothetical protein
LDSTAAHKALHDSIYQPKGSLIDWTFYGFTLLGFEYMVHHSLKILHVFVKELLEV